MTDAVFDANSLFARSWYAALREDGIGSVEETARIGLQTLLLLLDPQTARLGRRVDRVLFGWDSKRKEAKNRSAKPPEYTEAKVVFRELLDAVFGGVSAEHPDYEGDDVVATAVQKSDADVIFVVSGDKDLMQLAGERVGYYSLHEKALLSEQFILNKWGVLHPSHVAIALAIIGDRVDCIKGVPRWGAKKTKGIFRLIDESMSFDEVIDFVYGQIPENLRSFFVESLERTLLVRDVPGVPAPARLAMIDPREFEKLGIPDMTLLYNRVWRLY